MLAEQIGKFGVSCVEFEMDEWGVLFGVRDHISSLDHDQHELVPSRIVSPAGASNVRRWS